MSKEEAFSFHCYVSRRLKFHVMCYLGLPKLKVEELEFVVKLLSMVSVYGRSHDGFDELVEAENRRKAKEESMRKVVKVARNKREENTDG